MTLEQALEMLADEFRAEQENTGNDDEKRALIRAEVATRRAAERVGYREWEDRMGDSL